MADLKAIARTVRWGAESMAFQLAQLPADKLDWKPNPASKSALQVAGEVIGVMELTLPLFQGKGFEFQQFPPPANLEEAQRLLKEKSDALAAALEAAGPELDQAIDTPMGPLWGTYAVTFGMIDLLHHHGQITYIQSLLGDAENHTDMGSLERWFGPPR
jgi:hypothetical protein